MDAIPLFDKIGFKQNEMIQVKKTLQWAPMVF